MTIKVFIIESERGWGSRVDEVREFDTHQAASDFATEYNSFNTAEEVPAWYMYAQVEGEGIHR